MNSTFKISTVVLKIFVAALFWAIFLSSFSKAFAAELPKNKALKKVRMGLWYQGVAKQDFYMPEIMRTSEGEIKKKTNYPIELQKALEIAKERNL